MSNPFGLEVYTAAVDLSTKQYALVKASVDGSIVLGTEGSVAFALQDNPRAGRNGTIATAGITKVQLGGTVAMFSPLECDANGHAVAALSGGNVVGIACYAGVAGDVGRMIVVAAASNLDASGVRHVNPSGAAQTIPPPSAAKVNHVTLTAHCALTFPTIAPLGLSLAVAEHLGTDVHLPNASFALVLQQDGTGSRIVTWPGSVSWDAGSAPTLTTTAGKSDVLTFICADGTNWLGFVAGQDLT